MSPNSNQLHSLQVENCDSNSRLVVNEDDNGKFRIERAKVLIATIAIFIPFYKPLKSLSFGTKRVHKLLQMFGLKLNNFNRMEDVGRGSETQLQVVKNLNNLI